MGDDAGSAGGEVGADGTVTDPETDSDAGTATADGRMARGDAGSGAGEPDGTAADAGANPGGGDDAYGGVLGAVPYAFRASDSRLFRSYVVVGGGLALGVTLLFVFGVVVLLGRTATVAGGTFTFSRTFFAFVGFLVVVPLVGPLLLVARRHRRGRPDRRYDATLAAMGYLFVAALYVGLVASTPPIQQQPVEGVLAPVVGILYALPQLAGLVPPVAVAVAMWLVHRRWN